MVQLTRDTVANAAVAALALPAEAREGMLRKAVDDNVESILKRLGPDHASDVELWRWYLHVLVTRELEE